VLRPGRLVPDLFADIIDAGFHLLTYRKNDTGKDAPALPGEAFTTAGSAGDDGCQHQYDLAGTSVELAISKGRHKGRVLELRQVTRRQPGRGDTSRQVHILTTRPAGDLPAPGVIYRMTCRWREESYFRYGRAHFAPGALDSYATVPDDPRRLVPNPAKKTAAAAVTAAKNAAAKAEAGPAGEAHRAAQPRPRDQHHQQDARPAPGSRPRRPPPGPSRRRSRSASTTPGRCGWRPRPS
jgi:hypothetical protein